MNLRALKNNTHPRKILFHILSPLGNVEASLKLTEDLKFRYLVCPVEPSARRRNRVEEIVGHFFLNDQYVVSANQEKRVDIGFSIEPLMASIEPNNTESQLQSQAWKHTAFDAIWDQLDFVPEGAPVQKEYIVSGISRKMPFAQGVFPIRYPYP